MQYFRSLNMPCVISVRTIGSSRKGKVSNLKDSVITTGETSEENGLKPNLNVLRNISNFLLQL